jgi:4-amino-4-deoxy-L-arabinose transferase-like glycosyltransferase
MSVPRAKALEVGALLLVLLVAAVPRLVVLNADPPVRVSAALVTDEGWWAQNARQHALFGKWVMDQHNPALYVTPVYTLALRGVYEVAGVGIWQTRLVSALSGILTCLALYAGLRAVLPRRRALFPALVLALSLMGITLNRIAFTESLQLLLATLSLAAVLWAAHRPAWGVAGGIALVLAVLCKPNAAVLAPIIAGFWAGELWRARESAGPLLVRVRPMLILIATALAATLVTVLVFLLPQWADIRHQLSISLANVYGVNRRLDDGGALFFFLPWLGLRPTMLTASTVIPWLGVIVLAWRRCTRSGVTTSDPAERLMWWWLGGGILFQALQSYQPDRRFLILLPPLVVLGWRGLVEEGLRVAPGRAPSGLVAHLLAGLTGGAILGLLFLGWWADSLTALLAGVSVGGEPGIAPGTIQQLLWHGAVALGVGVALLCWRWAPGRGMALRAWLWLPLWLLLEPWQVARDLRHSTYALRDAALSLARLSAQLPADRRAVTGDLANTMALRSDLFAFVIRDQARTGAHLNLDGWERFRPGLLVSASRLDRYYGYPGPNDLHGFIPLCTFPMRYRPDGSLLMEATIWHAPDLSLTPDCPPDSRPGR